MSRISRTTSTGKVLSLCADEEESPDTAFPCHVAEALSLAIVAAEEGHFRDIVILGVTPTGEIECINTLDYLGDLALVRDELADWIQDARMGLIDPEE